MSDAEASNINPVNTRAQTHTHSALCSKHNKAHFNDHYTPSHAVNDITSFARMSYTAFASMRTWGRSQKSQSYPAISGTLHVRMSVACPSPPCDVTLITPHQSLSDADSTKRKLLPTTALK